MKKQGIALVCVAVLLMTGCGAVLPEMTDEQADAIGEYAAITLLKYDANSRSRLVDLSQIKEEAVLPEELETLPQEEKQPEEIPDVSDTPAADHQEDMWADSMESFLELPEGISVTYLGYETCQSYQEENSLYFALEAAEGRELLVLRFSLQNHSEADCMVDLVDRKDQYRVTVNGSYTRIALTTMLANDLSTYMGTVPAGGAEDVVLLLEIAPEEVGTVENITLNLKDDSNAYTIQLL